MSLPALAAAAKVATAIGTGISVYGQIAAGRSEAAIANYNARQQELDAERQMMAMQAQASLQRREAEANFALREAEANARFSNAKMREDEAHNQDAINRINLRKKRQDAARLQSEQRAAIATSGIVESTGTPLDILAETASRIQQDQEETHYANELRRRTIFREAQLERLGGKLALAGSTLDRDSSLAAADLRDATARAAGQSGRRQAEITRLTGRSAQPAANIGAVGTLFSGFNRYADIKFKTS